MLIYLIIGIIYMAATIGVGYKYIGEDLSINFKDPIDIFSKAVSVVICTIAWPIAMIINIVLVSKARRIIKNQRDEES